MADELVQVTEELRRTRVELAAANRELEAIVYSLSHDLRAPLRTINGFASVLAEDYAAVVDAEGKKHLDRIATASIRLDSMIADLVQLVRLTAEPERQEIDVSAVARTIIDILIVRQPDRTVDVVIAAGLRVVADPAQFRVALHHLLDNAWKFTRHVPAARIEVGALDRDGERVLFVRDNGTGFLMTSAAKLFKPFQRLHAPSEYEGNGIGLAMVHRVLARHGGRVWIESVKGEGTTLFFVI